MNKFNKIALKFLVKKDDIKHAKAFHQLYKCAEIHHCKYAHMNILRSCKAYDKIKIENINQLQRHFSRFFFNASVDERILKHTKKYIYSAYIINCYKRIKIDKTEQG